jgi:ATP phosphoribosyltransferase regulatory subunit
MALQPAAGARDLNPRQVEGNRRIRQTLAGVYRLWGYQEVDPPSVETLDTLAAGGGIAPEELVRLVSDDPLGLRPELTASIARAACTRMADHPLPLRLWADGNIFRCSQGDGGRLRIHQQIQSGVELLGEPSLSADVELVRLLLAATGSLGLQAAHRPTLLMGHHGLLQALLEPFAPGLRDQARAALTSYDRLSLQTLESQMDSSGQLLALLELRGRPLQVLAQLQHRLGDVPLLQDLRRVIDLVSPAAQRLGVELQLDPTFQPHYDLYDGLVLKLVCQGADVPIAIASGGRYDALVGRFSTPASLMTLPAAGVGFGFDVEHVRELVCSGRDGQQTVLVARGPAIPLEEALEKVESLHSQGTAAELLGEAVADRSAAEEITNQRGCRDLIWLGP